MEKEREVRCELDATIRFVPVSGQDSNDLFYLPLGLTDLLIAGNQDGNTLGSISYFVENPDLTYEVFCWSPFILFMFLCSVVNHFIHLFENERHF
jgi:hypothetical protein